MDIAGSNTGVYEIFFVYNSGVGAGIERLFGEEE
jgi:hypothetical protein